MLLYTTLLLIPALSALLTRRRASLAVLTLFAMFLIVVVGLRHKVGMDWNNYQALHLKLSYISLEEAMQTSEVGFNLIAWTSERLGFSVYGTNFISAVLFAVGLVTFARTTLNPWMALVGVAPYLTAVVAMSATRQTAALGLLLFIFGRWRQSTSVTRMLFILLAASIHLSALFCLAFVLLESRISPLKKMVLLGLLAAALAVVIPASEEHFAYYSEAYIEGAAEVESAGALAHVALLAGPGALYLYMRRQWARRLGPDPLLTGMVVLSLLSVPGVLLFSTAVDRMSLYLYAVPMAVYANLPYLVARGHTVRTIQVLIIGLNLAVLVGWLLFANSAAAYLPYSNVLFN